MSRWQLFVSAVELGVAAAILSILVWAAGTRAAVQQQWKTLRRELAERDASLRRWCVALGTVAGCA
jgi:hypothetical protein